MRTILTPTNACVKPTYLQFDNLDDRREIRELLARLPPRKRIAFMQWWLAQVHLGPWLTLVPELEPETIRLAERARYDNVADAQLNYDLYTTLWACASSYEGLSLDSAFNRLVEMVKGKSQ
jgi:hypothetical protein